MGIFKRKKFVNDIKYVAYVNEQNPFQIRRDEFRSERHATLSLLRQYGEDRSVNNDEGVRFIRHVHRK